VKPTVQGFVFLPLALSNPIFNDLTGVLGQVDGSFQLPVYKGLGVGVGIDASFYQLNEHGLAVGETPGSVSRLLYYGKVNWTAYTGPQTFYELSAKFGQSTWNWDCTTCTSNEKQPGFHWGLNATYFVHATDNLAFGLSLGYEADGTSFGPEVIGLENFPGRTDTGGPYHFITVGLGFSTAFAKSDAGMW
ncbi:MAG: hypothetical protein ABI373_06880, partial [Flavobacteriales bacterium]